MRLVPSPIDNSNFLCIALATTSAGTVSSDSTLTVLHTEAPDAVRCAITYAPGVGPADLAAQLDAGTVTTSPGESGSAMLTINGSAGVLATASPIETSTDTVALDKAQLASQLDAIDTASASIRTSAGL